ncbi:MAG: GlsB/YeaQ/YmgE family stress response membrane protein [Acidimicrobiales bacterium]|nr:GlsB/YeaQ/YmgE family stress response membrane protein [Acidimicrobiales bacterium]HMS88890.1 GlsB/YeaQ/YmgE family stress response membrane protein [Acidimicrobiales bacterium]
MILLAILLWGMLSGWLANLILGGSSRPDDWGPLLVAGLAGSFVGGMVLNLITGNGLDLAPSGLIGTVLGAVIVLAVWNAVSRRKG